MKRLFLLCLMASLLTACGKHEAKKGTIGTVAGATIGAAISSDKSKGEGALLGALIGNYIGREVGKEKDKKEVQTAHEAEVNQLKAENQHLKHQLQKWCPCCNRKITIQGAQSCPQCGTGLIQEKLCTRCHTSFAPNTGYRYCPYCSTKTTLRSR